MGGVVRGDYNNAYKAYIRKAYLEAIHIVSMHGSKKYLNLMGLEITFLEKEAYRLLHPHTDALVFTVLVANINMYRISIDNGSSTNILFSKAWKTMKLTHPLPSEHPISGIL